MRCRPEALTALVDGELDHGARERVQAHLAHCAPCRTEVDEQRRLKARLRVLGGPCAPLDLVARLHALPAPGGDPLHRPPLPAGPPPRRVGVGPAGRRPRSRTALRKRSAVATAALVGGVAGLALLGSPTPTRPAVDPGSPALVVDHVSTTGAGPAGTPAGPVVVPARGPWR